MTTWIYLFVTKEEERSVFGWKRWALCQSSFSDYHLRLFSFVFGYTCFVKHHCFYCSFLRFEQTPNLSIKLWCYRREIISQIVRLVLCYYFSLWFFFFLWLRRVIVNWKMSAVVGLTSATVWLMLNRRQAVSEGNHSDWLFSLSNESMNENKSKSNERKQRSKDRRLF